VVGISSGIYLSNFLLEMENFLIPLSQARRQVKQQNSYLATIEKIGSNLFELYFKVRDLQGKYLPFVENENVTLKSEFSLHSWYEIILLPRLYS
jgi:hypothetical protein